MVAVSAWPPEVVMRAAVVPKGPQHPNITHKQRNQALSASSLVHNGTISTSQVSPYDHSRQLHVINEVAKVKAVRPKPAANLPSPRDCKATMLQGSGAVQIGDGSDATRKQTVQPNRAPRKPGLMQFGVGSEPMEVVQANNLDLKTACEYWTQSPRMDWGDTRGELIRQQEVKDSLSRLSAGARKQQDMSSQVLGGTTATERSATGAPPPKLSPRARPPLSASSSEQNLRTQREPPMSARDCKAKHLSTSRDCQLSGYGAPRKAAPLETPRDTEKAFRDATDERSRRGDHQYSSLFGRTSTRRTSPSVPLTKRSELHDFPNSCWADASTEISTKRVNRLRSKQEGCLSPTDSVGLLIHQPGPKPEPEALSPRSMPESARERLHRQEERACWDVASGMQSSVEIARRRRGYRMAMSTGNLHQSQQEPTPPDRKMAQLTSGQVRLGTGAPLEPHDDGSPSKWTVSGTKRVTVSPAPSPSASARNIMNSPALHAFRSIPPCSPRGRKIQEMMTSEGIF
eukprot:TRINITY_DN107852_c0_g1_i1.p1 TRINITY_DN107852_c0_g1~~TRINITY_DN107852_c0_g1_i1.p1  ORF type:complete len:529 (+),score=75.78 TRINITY_DN107852_c0_g1_i1:45-1589(+)